MESVHPLLRQFRRTVARQAVKDRTDSELLQQFAALRDESAFTVLVERYGPVVWGVCHRVLGDRHDAEDAFQATFLVLARRAGSVCKKEAAGSWLYGVAYRIALSQKRATLRRQRREKHGQLREAEQPASAASLRELQAILDEEVARLPAKYRAPFVLCCLEGKSYAHAAREIGCKEGTVASRLALARKQLQVRLIRRGITLSAALCATALSLTVEAAPAALIAATTEGVLRSLTGTTTAALSAQAVILANGVTKMLSAKVLKLGAILLLTVAPLAAGAGLLVQPKPAAPQQAEAGLRADRLDEPMPARDKAEFVEAEEMHVLGVYGAKNGFGQGGRVDVEVRRTPRPIVLVLTSYYSVDWHVTLAEGARVNKAIVSGYFAQEIQGLPANIPVVNRSYFTGDLSRRKEGWFWAYAWNMPQWREMVRRLNEMSGLPVASFQGKYEGDSFIVDGKRGRDGFKNQPKDEDDPLADVADIPSQELRVADDANKRYFLIGPKKDPKPPAEGYGLLVIMPGGDGSADFHPFVKRIYKNALPDGYLAAQPVAFKWTPDQQIVWPTKTNPVAEMKFTTEEFVDAVIDDVAKKHKLDRARIFSLSWSSSGPAAYAISLRNKSRVKGSFVAMSIFNPKFLPPLKAAKGHAYYLYHSPDDRVCPYRMADQAKTRLMENGAKVRLETYEGGHGWRGDVYGNIRKGVEWLEKNREKARPRD